MRKSWPQIISEFLYMARKFLGIVDRFMSFAACQKCHKLYKKEDVISQDKQSIMNCNHIEFPNSNTKRFKQCRTPLGKKITLNNRVLVISELVYPITSIKQQLSSMFLRPRFKKSTVENVLSNIYDGQVWQNLKKSSE